MELTPEQIRAELEPTAPLYAELVALWHPAPLPEVVPPPFLPTTQNYDTVVADVLNRKDRPGYIPAAHVNSVLARFPELDAVIHWAMRTGALPDGSSLASRFALYALFCNLSRVDRSAALPEPLRADVGRIRAGLEAFQSAAPTLVPEGFGDALLAGEVRFSRAEELAGVGAVATAVAVETARLTLDPVPPPA